jgi:hypothetical protein
MTSPNLPNHCYVLIQVCFFFIFIIISFYSITISKHVRSYLWLFTSAIGIFSMFFVTIYYIPEYKFTQFENALYNCAHRLGWSVFTAWIVLGCVTSEGNVLKSFLSSQVLVPLSRLTYCAYLTNGFIELYLAASMRSPKYMSIANLVILYFFSVTFELFLLFQCHTS